MLEGLQVAAVLLVALAWALATAHALEWPDKRQLDKDAYYTVQRIYYPGFTAGGIAEVVAMPATALLAFFTPRDSAAFWLVVAAFAGMVAMQAVYWLVTHPV